MQIALHNKVLSKPLSTLSRLELLQILFGWHICHLHKVRSFILWGPRGHGKERKEAGYILSQELKA